MNTFLFFMCIALIATDAAHLGYNYQQPRPVHQNFSQQFVAPASAYTSPVPQVVAPTPQYIAAPQQQTIISKDIYIHSAPEETEEIILNQDATSVPNRKNYRVVFIKAPSQNIRFNMESLKRNQATNEERTVIYVLAKKPEVTTIQEQLATIQTEQKLHKPEVYFIKYKTQEEANRAQQEIQAQYDALGGSTQVSDEGVAPVTSVIGSAGPAFSAGSASGLSFSSGSNFVQSANNNHQQFVQSASSNRQQSVHQSFKGSQVAASSISLDVAAPSNQQQFVQQSFKGSQGAASSISLGLATPSNQQQFVQQSFKGSQGAASSISLGLAVPPTNRYLPTKIK